MSTDDAAAPGGLMPPRWKLPAADKMKFWVKIFPEAMSQVKQKPSLKLKADFTIREKTSWDDVLAQLQKARETYDGTKKGWFGKYKRARRNFMDRSSCLGTPVEIMKEIEYLSIPMAAVEVLLEAMQKAGEVRETVKEMPGQLEHKFGIIEVFLASFPGDANIREASIKLVVSVFLAIEKAIEFFLKPEFRRSTAALMKGEKYEEKLLDRISQIQGASDHLIEVARLSEVAGNREAMIGLLEGNLKIVQSQEIMSTKLDSIEDCIKDCFPELKNMIKNLLDEADKERKKSDRRLKKELRWERRKRRKERQVHAQLCLPQETPQILPPWSFVPYREPPVPVASNHGSQPLLWPLQPIRQIGPAQSTPSITVDVLLALLCSHKFDDRDVGEVMGSRELISLTSIAQAEQVPGTREFMHWAIAAESTELLVEDNTAFGEAHDISALSVLCATLTQTLRTRDRYISLVFFCGCHPGDDGDGDDYHNATAGGTVMIKSLIAQLLEQYGDFDLTELGHKINRQRIVDSDLNVLCTLLSWLVERLPDELTLVFIVDGAIHYEIDRYRDKFIKVVECVLGLSKHQDIAFPIKVLITSPAQTESVREFFNTEEEDGSYLTLNEAHNISYGFQFKDSGEESAADGSSSEDDHSSAE